MEYIYAAMLLHKAGKEITEESLKKVLEGAGVKPDDARVKAVVAALEGVNIEEAIKEAMSAQTVAAPATAAPAAEASSEKKEEKKKEEEKSEADAAAGLGALFG